MKPSSKIHFSEQLDRIEEFVAGKPELAADWEPFKGIIFSEKICKEEYVASCNKAALFKLSQSLHYTSLKIELMCRLADNEIKPHLIVLHQLFQTGYDEVFSIDIKSERQNQKEKHKNNKRNSINGEEAIAS